MVMLERLNVNTYHRESKLYSVNKQSITYYVIKRSNTKLNNKKHCQAKAKYI